VTRRDLARAPVVGVGDGDEARLGALVEDAGVACAEDAGADDGDADRIALGGQRELRVGFGRAVG